MSYYSTIMNQLLQLIPRHKFDNLVKKYEVDHYVRYFNCWQLFITLLYAQIRKKDSLRDIETSLLTQSNKWYHLGLKDIKRSTLSDANNRMDYRVFEEMFYVLLDKCRSLCPRHKLPFKNLLYSLDSTVIDLCLSVFPWAKFRQVKGALRLVGYIDEQTNKEFTFLTNNFQLSADTIAQIYKSRWQIEIFFKWIKQNLKIKSFLGTSKNAVLAQIWIAMIYYLLLSFIKFQTKYRYSLLDLSRIFEEAAMNMVNIIDLLSCKDYNSFRTRIREPDQQLTLSLTY